jgi:Ca2+-binding RTX toxin-like protein
LQFILQQIRIAESHRAIEGTTAPEVVPSTNVLVNGRALSDPRSASNTGAARTITVTAASTRVLSPLLPEGLRQVDGRNNNLTSGGFSSWIGFTYISPTIGKSDWGAADTYFPRMAPVAFRSGYSTRTGDVTDAAPRLISNLISDQSESNPAARASASCTLRSDGKPNPCVPSVTDNVSLTIPNRATNGVAAPYNGLFTLFGQFFDHGLDLVGKSATDVVKIPLAVSDPLYSTCVNLTNRGCVTEIDMSRTVLGSDSATAGSNVTTPWVDQNQTYTSHPSHQVFLREYKCASELSNSINPNLQCSSSNPPVATGKLLDGAIAGNIANWAEVKKQALNKLGIELVDMDIHDVPLLLTDEYGRFLRSASGFPQVVQSISGSTATVAVGDPLSPATARLGTGHAFLNDIAHFAAPAIGLLPDTDTQVNNYPGSGKYDNELLDAHFITGDGRGNENIGLTAVHTIFHAEHNRLWTDIQNVINDATTTTSGLSAAALADFKSAWRLSSITSANPDPEWNGERLFQASRFITEMEYQHLVFGEFARKVQPLIKPFVAYDPTIRPDITAEFAHAVYRYGHSQLNETVDRTSSSGTDLSVPLLYAFLNPTEFNQPHTYPGASVNGTSMTGAQAAGSIVRGMSMQTGNEIDEFVTGALRNSLLGLPLDLATLNIARGRDSGIQTLNNFRRTLKTQTGITSLTPYGSWVEFGQSLRHPESLVNFIAAYGNTAGSLTFLNGATADANDTVTVSLNPADNTVAYTGKRAAAQSIIDCFDAYHGLGTESCETFMLGNSGLNDIDLWVGGLAEKNTFAGTMLGSTFDYVFKKQLEKLQESDRFYYLGRLAGLNLTVQVETNFFSDIIMRNTDVNSITTDAFVVPTFTVNMAQTAPAYIKILSDGTWMYTGTGHVLWNGTTGNDRVLSDRGDDSIYGDAGNDWLRGGDGNDFIQGGDGRDVIEDSAGLNIFIGGNGNDYISGSGTDSYNGNAGDDFIFGGGFPVVALGGIGNDWIRGGTDNDTLSGDDGDDWMEGAEGSDTIAGDVVGPAGVTLTRPGRDILIGGTGNDLLDGFDGADIYIPGDGTDLNTGGLGFDWATYFNDGQVGGVTEDLANFAPAPGLVLANLADQFQEVEGLSGGDGDDDLSGTSVTTLGGTASNGLSATDCALITGLTALLPSTITNCVWNTGDILIGGAGSDVITGRNGNDLIDGDAVLQVWISIPSAWGIANEAPSYVTVPADRAYVSGMSIIQQYISENLISSDVIADLQIVRLIAQTGHSTENDVAVYQTARANYTITVNANGTITVRDPRNGGGATIDGTDTLRNIETLRFTDGDVLVSTLLPAQNIAVTTSAAGAVNGQAFTTQPVIEIRNVNGAVVTNSTATVTATVSTGATIVGTATANAVAGIATFTNLGISGVAGTAYTITYSISVPTSITTNQTITPTASTTNLVIRTPLSGATSGAVATTQPVIEIKDVNGAVVTSSTATVTASVSAGATVSGTTTANASSGIATFTNLIVTGTAGSIYTLTYSLSTGEIITQSVTLSGTAPVAVGTLSVAPSGVTVTSAASTATVTWAAVSGATRYTAQAFISTTSTKVLRQCSVTGNNSAPTFSCTIPRLQRLATYYIDVVARNQAGAISTVLRLPITIQ